MRVDLPRHRTPLFAAAATFSIVAVGVLTVVATPALLSGWRLAVTLALGLAIGSLMLVAIGRLLDNRWRHAIEDELLPAAWLLPPVLLLALPLLALPAEPPAAIFGPGLTPAQATWFAPALRLVRLTLCAIALIGALLVVTRSRRPAANAIALAVAAIAAFVVLVDWVMPVQPLWWSHMLPFATLCSQLSAGIALAFVIDAVIDSPAREAEVADSLGTALLALALVTIWVWFAQYLTAWTVDLPNEAAWYVARAPGNALLAAAAALQLGAILLLIVLRRRPKVALLASLAMLAAHALHSLWFFRPAAILPPVPQDFVAGAAMTLLVALWLATSGAMLPRATRSADADDADSS